MVEDHFPSISRSNACNFPKTESYQSKDITINVRKLMNTHKEKPSYVMSKEEVHKMKVIKENELAKF